MAAKTVENELFVRLNVPKLYKHESEFVFDVSKRFNPRTPFAKTRVSPSALEDDNVEVIN